MYINLKNQMLGELINNNNNNNIMHEHRISQVFMGKISRMTT